MKVLYYDCFAGISGDMHLGAMLDLGVKPEVLTGQLNKLDLEGYEIKISKDQRKGISGTRVDVILEKHDHHTHRNLDDISDIINNSRLSDPVKDRSLSMFRKLAEAEARVHGKDIKEIHFHEVGAVDSIVDIVGAAICLEELKPERIISSTVELGGGFVKCAHGTFPVPAPATAEILSGIPVCSGAAQSETTTPTGAVIIACNADEFGPIEGLRIIKTAYGIGQRDIEIPNVLRLFWAEKEEIGSLPVSSHQSVLVECNIDDMNPEFYGYVMEKLFDAGAASKLSVLCNPDKEDVVIQAVLSHSTSLGVRSYMVNKTLLDREYNKLNTRYGEVTLKTAIYNGKKLKSKPEYEDCIRLAREHDIPVQKIYDEIARLVNDEK